MSHKGCCDKCMKGTRVKRLSLGGGSGVFLCKPCWAKEMAWRKQRNKELPRGSKFSILKFS